MLPPLEHGRPLREEEKRLILAIAGTTSALKLRQIGDLDDIRVLDMNDGGMGSVRVIGSDDVASRRAVPVASGLFADEDGVPISVQLNNDQFGRLYEIDIWKADFSSVKKYPSPSVEMPKLR